MKTQELLKKELSAPLPSEAISQHPTKTYLSSIKAIYVTERLNDVFGIGQWQTKVEKIADGEKGMIVVKVTFSVPEYNIYYECFGGNDNGGETNKNFDLGDAYKGATTDAITKIGSFLEIGIDVFKGKSQGAAQPKKEYPQNDLPWINDKQVDAMVERIKAGEQGIIEKAKQAFKISKANMDKLINAK
jgi:hypothetical protein